MKPEQMFAGQAPAAMAQMGAGWPQVGASIANSTLAGYEGMAKGIGAGIASVADAYAKHKEMQQTNKAYENLVKNPVAQKALGLNADTAQQFLMQADNLGTKEKHNLFSTFIPMTLQQNALQQKTDTEKQLASDRIAAENWRALEAERAASERTKMQIEGQQAMPWIQGSAAVLQQGNLGGMYPNKNAGYGGGVVQPMIGSQPGAMQIQGFTPSRFSQTHGF